MKISAKTSAVLDLPATCMQTAVQAVQSSTLYPLMMVEAARAVLLPAQYKCACVSRTLGLTLQRIVARVQLCVGVTACPVFGRIPGCEAGLLCC